MSDEDPKVPQPTEERAETPEEREEARAEKETDAILKEIKTTLRLVWQQEVTFTSVKQMLQSQRRMRVNDLLDVIQTTGYDEGLIVGRIHPDQVIALRDRLHQLFDMVLDEALDEQEEDEEADQPE